LFGYSSRCSVTRPSTISRLRWRTLAISTATEPVTIPKVAAWCSRSATLALQISFLLGRQAIFGHEPPIHVQAILKEAGLDPTKDIDRAVLAIVPGPEGMGGPFFVVEGRFDPDKLAAAAESLGKRTGGAKKLDIGKVKAFEMHFGPGDPAVIAILNKNA